jgi:phage shock protein PspC (stress-responsive transcriptional regulator)
MKRLYRSDTNQQLAGVCAGLAEYFNLDVTLVRLVFVLLTLAGGPGLIAYIVMWSVAPTESEVRAKYSDYKGQD